MSLFNFVQKPIKYNCPKKKEEKKPKKTPDVSYLHKP